MVQQSIEADKEKITGCRIRDTVGRKTSGKGCIVSKENCLPRQVHRCRGVGPKKTLITRLLWRNLSEIAFSSISFIYCARTLTCLNLVLAEISLVHLEKMIHQEFNQALPKGKILYDFVLRNTLTKNIKSSSLSLGFEPRLNLREMRLIRLGFLSFFFSTGSILFCCHCLFQLDCLGLPFNSCLR